MDDQDSIQRRSLCGLPASWPSSTGRMAEKCSYLANSSSDLTK